MTKEEAFKFLANRIWDHDTSKEYHLMPSGFSLYIGKTYREASDCLAKERYTNYIHTWVKRGHSVRLKLFKGAFFISSTYSFKDVPTHTEFVTL